MSVRKLRSRTKFSFFTLVLGCLLVFPIAIAAINSSDLPFKIGHMKFGFGPFPPSGEKQWFFDFLSSEQSKWPTLEIVGAENPRINSWVILEDWDWNAPRVKVSVRAHETVHLKVPPGKYRVRFVHREGFQWGLTEERSYVADKPIEFISTANRVVGQTILIDSVAGNMNMRKEHLPDTYK